MTLEKSSNEVLSEKLNEFFPNEVVEVKEQPKIEEPKKAVPNPMLEEIEEELTEEMEQEEAQEEGAKKEAEDKQDSENKDILKNKLSGYPKQFREVVESVKDEPLRAKFLEAGQLLRAREDQVRLELGNLKKEYNTAKGLIQMIGQDPVNALKHIAKVTKIDLASLVDKPVQDDEYDYRTPEEKARDKQLEDIKQELLALKNQKSTDELQTIEQEIESFADSKDEDGDLKYPHFEKLQDSIFEILGFEKQRLGVPKNSQERLKRLEKAYNKAVLLDDELVAEREEELLRKSQERKREEIEKAKKLRKFTGKSSVNVKPASSKDALSSIYDKWAAGSI